ncbi:MAG: EAL domain-containing protein [Bacillota bacterium]|nr:EAL domain-containing protein [Bacillota bacterium]
MERTAFMKKGDKHNFGCVKKDYIFLRIISLAIAVFDLSISLSIKSYNPHAPFYIVWTAVFFIAFLSLFISTITSKFVKENASTILYVTYFLSSIALVYNCYSYDFLVEQSWLIMFAISAVTLIIRKLSHLVLYLITISTSSIVLLFWMDNPVVSKQTFSMTLIMLCLIVYFSMRVKFGAQSALEQSQDQIRQMAYYDALTGLPNRNSLNDYLNESITKADKTGQKLAVMFIDLDNFKNINDIFGHNFGDMLLKQAGSRLLSCISTEGTVFRYGGDEFIVLLDNTGEKECVSLAERIIIDFSHPFEVYTNEIYSSPSIGISIYPQHGQDAETIIKNSDNAMYLAKKHGKNNFQFFNQGLSRTLSRKIDLENGLRKALQNNELFLCYQPLVEINSRRIFGFEALLRWNHPSLGMISPAEFIPLAEESGLIVPIGLWVLETACRQSKAWRESYSADILISINASGYQFTYSDFCKDVNEILKGAGSSPESVIIEITESVMQDSRLASQIVRELKEIGVKVAIDDFGTGYSSLGLLKNLDIDILKIDSSFISDVSGNPNTLAILDLIINMGNKLNFDIIIEGIETEPQADLLKRNSCRFGQGYLFSRPLPVNDIEAMLKRNKEIYQTSSIGAAVQ